jgi:hypothetical protein
VGRLITAVDSVPGMVMPEPVAGTVPVLNVVALGVAVVTEIDPTETEGNVDERGSVESGSVVTAELNGSPESGGEGTIDGNEMGAPLVVIVRELDAGSG